MFFGIILATGLQNLFHSDLAAILKMAAKSLWDQIDKMATRMFKFYMLFR